MKLTLPDFNRLRVFHAIYERRGIQEAARALHVTRSAVSQSLRALETELGVTLFLRSSRSVIATKEAEALFATIGPFVQDLTTTIGGLARGKIEPHGVLRIGGPQDFGARRLVEACARFRKRHHDVRFELTLAIPPKLLEGVSRGELDVAFVDNGDAFENQYPVKMAPACEETFILCGSSRYVRTHLEKDLGYDALTSAQFVDYVASAPVAKMWFKHHFRKVPSALALSLSVESVHGVLTAIRGDLGLGVVPEQIVADELRRGRMVKIDGPKAPFVNKIMTAQAAGKSPSLAERLFIQSVIAEDH